MSFVYSYQWLFRAGVDRNVDSHFERVFFLIPLLAVTFHVHGERR